MSRPQLDLSEIQAIADANGIDRETYPVYEVAIRGYYLDSVGKPGKNDRGAFDDASFVVFPGADGNDNVARFNRNTDPVSWKKNRATLCTGIHLMAPGPHPMRGGYPAWRQAETFTVTRDGRSGRFSGFFGINNHKAYGWVGSWGKTSSYGCQTIPKAQWSEYQRTTYALTAEHGNRLGYADWQLWRIGEGLDPKPEAPILPYILIEETERRKGNLIVSKRYL